MKKILLVSPHPDDEAIYAAGLLLRLRKTGVSVDVLFATTGENGRTLGLTSQENLKHLRKKEAENAASIFGIEKTIFLQNPDYDPETKSYTSELEFSRQIKEYLSREDYSFLITIDENGINGHPDHIAVFHACQQICADDNLPIISYSVSNHYSYPKKKGYFEVQSIENWPKLVINLSKGEFEKKIFALSQYKTQALSIADYLDRNHLDISSEFYLTRALLPDDLKNLFDK